MTFDTSKRVYVAGHRGLVGSAILRALDARGFQHIITCTHAELDLTDQAAVRHFFAEERIAHVYLAAARVGGIHANNSYPADFIRDNLLIQTNVIDAAWRNGVERLLFLGSSCIYPRMAPQPIPEDCLLTGLLEPTNEPYAIAKIAGIKMCESYRRQHGADFRSVMPTNLYGPGDNFDLNSSHVMPALIRKAHEAKLAGAPSITIWGTGTPRREFLHVDDCADACVHLMKNHSAAGHVNIGSGEDVTILELTQVVCDAVGYKGTIEHDLTKPDGTPRKLLDVSRLAALGWRARTALEDGIRLAYDAAPFRR